MAVFRTIKINGSDVFMPNGFTPQREHVYAAEITTCTGKTIADRIGWKYSDMTLEWGTLPQDQLDVLLAMDGTDTITFTDVDGTTVTEEIFPLSNVWIGTRFLGEDGEPLWKDIRLSIRFVNAH